LRIWRSFPDLSEQKNAVKEVLKMFKSTSVLLLLIISQYNYGEEAKKSIFKFHDTTYVQAMTAGVFFGGSYFGLDYEHLVYDKIAYQIGCGALGYDFAINYHLRPKVNSSAFSLNYSNLGGYYKEYTAKSIGIEYIFRRKKRFEGITFKIGVRYVLKYSDEAIAEAEELDRKLSSVKVTLGAGFYWGGRKIDWSVL
jgi:hypothetical protein